MGEEVSKAPAISINDHTMEVMEEFTYLRLTITSNLFLHVYINKRIDRKGSNCHANATQEGLWDNSKLNASRFEYTRFGPKHPHIRY